MAQTIDAGLGDRALVALLPFANAADMTGTKTVAEIVQTADKPPLDPKHFVTAFEVSADLRASLLAVGLMDKASRQIEQRSAAVATSDPTMILVNVNLLEQALKALYPLARMIEEVNDPTKPFTPPTPDDFPPAYYASQAIKAALATVQDTADGDSYIVNLF